MRNLEIEHDKKWNKFSSFIPLGWDCTMWSLALTQNSGETGIEHGVPKNMGFQ